MQITTTYGQKDKHEINRWNLMKVKIASNE